MWVSINDGNKLNRFNFVSVHDVRVCLYVCVNELKVETSEDFFKEIKSHSTLLMV